MRREILGVLLIACRGCHGRDGGGHSSSDSGLWGCGEVWLADLQFFNKQTKQYQCTFSLDSSLLLQLDLRQSRAAYFQAMPTGRYMDLEVGTGQSSVSH